MHHSKKTAEQLAGGSPSSEICKALMDKTELDIVLRLDPKTHMPFLDGEWNQGED